MVRPLARLRFLLLTSTRGMALHWAMESLAPILPDEILSRLDEARTDPFLNLTGEDAAIPLYDGKTGKLLTKVGGGPFLRVSRSKLRKLLSEGVEVKVSSGLWTLETNTDQASSVKMLSHLKTKGPQFKQGFKMEKKSLEILSLAPRDLVLRPENSCSEMLPRQRSLKERSSSTSPSDSTPRRR